MPSISEFANSVQTDGPVLMIQISANDPRVCPTESLFVGVPAAGVTLGDLEQLPNDLRDEYGWSQGYLERLEKRSGGIGADGVAYIGLFLGVVGSLPPIASLFKWLRRSTLVRPDRDEAWNTATWAVAIQYNTVERGKLSLLSETRCPDHWSFRMTLLEHSDEFEVDVYGSHATAIATKVVWSNGDPGGRMPGTPGLS
jgi:hypothetical protein